MSDSWPDTPEGKLAGDITHGPFANPLMTRILREFGKTAFARSSACMEFERFLLQIRARGKCCVEIGTFYGVSAIILSQYFEQVVCLTIDVDTARDMKYRIAERLGIRNIQFFDIATNADKKLLLDGIDFDFAYVDGDHVHDTVDDWQMTRRCGRVLFHEYWPLQAAVWNLINSFPADEVTRADVDCFAYWQRKSG